MKSMDKGKVALFFILCALSVSLGFQTSFIAPFHEDNQLAFRSFTEGLDEYQALKAAWRPRLITNFLAAQFVELGRGISTQLGLTAKQAFAGTVGVWSSVWFFLMGAVYIFVAGKRALFYLFGSYAALLFAYTVNHERVYPWDLPILFIFTLFLIFYVHRKYMWLLVLIPLGMGFKETVFILPLAFLFTDLPRKQRIQLCLFTTGLCVLVKIGIDFLVDAPLPFFTMEHRYNGSDGLRGLYVIRNIKEFFGAYFLPLLANGGTLLAFLLLPNRDRTVWVFKLLGGVFLSMLFVFALLVEYHVFFEMIPLALYSLACFAYGESFIKQPKRKSGIAGKERKHGLEKARPHTRYPELVK